MPNDKKNRDVPPPAPEPLPIPVADDHTHLDIQFAGQRQDGGWTSPPVDAPEVRAAIDAATAAGVDRLVQIGVDLASSRWSAEAAERHPELLAGVALHPNEAPRIAAEQGRDALEAAWAELEDLARADRVRVIGETGMDFYRTEPEGRAVQEESFRRHVDLAKRLGKTLQIHDRDAHEDVFRVLESEGAPERTVFHCFSGDAEMARKAVAHGWILSFAGTVTFKNAEPLREALRAVPLTHVTVETDAPFLTPHPYRGRPNGSYLVPVTVRSMAQITGSDLEEVCAALSSTAERVYGPW